MMSRPIKKPCFNGTPRTIAMTVGLQCFHETHARSAPHYPLIKIETHCNYAYGSEHQAEWSPSGFLVSAHFKATLGNYH